PEQKLKPGMTANLTITIDERNNVLKVPNSALRFTPADGQRSGGQWNGQRGVGQGAGQQRPANSQSGGAQNSGQDDQQGRRNFAPSTAPVLAGQTRLVWVLGQDGNAQSRRIKIGLTDGVSTEVVEGNLVEGELVITGQTTTGNRTQNNNQTS